MASISSTPTPSPTSPPNGHTAPDIQCTKILLLGQRRSGKTSILQVLFNDVQPKQTFYLEPTTRITKLIYDTVIPLELWDCPGTVSLDALSPLSQFSSIIFVIDIHDSYKQPIARLLEFFTAAFSENPDTPLEVFVHKAEAFTEDYKIENFRHIHQWVNDELDEISAEYEQMALNFHLTSVYDHSIHEAFSKVLHRLVDSLPYLEHLLNVFVANSQASKTFLFDVQSRLYIATDASPVDAGTHNLCCDFLKTLTAFGPLYKSASASPPRAAFPPSPSSPPATEKPPFYPSAALALAPPSAGMTLAYHLITPQLALLSVLPTAVHDARRGLVEYNVVFFREGVQEIVAVERDARVVRA